MNQHIPVEHGNPPIINPNMLTENPHANFAALRVHYPLICLGDKHYMALRAKDVLSLLTDPRTKQIEGRDYVRLNRMPESASSRFLSDFLLFSNDDEHRTKRGLFARTFAHGAMRTMRSEIRAVADRIVAELPRGEDFDFVDAMAARVPAEMIAAILGLPVADAPYFASRVYTLARAISPAYPHEEHAAIDAAASDLFAYVEGHMRVRLEMPRGDVLSQLVAGWQADPKISFQSLVNQVLGIVVAGSDTTRAAFAMMVALLLRHPDQWEAVKKTPSLIPGAVAEALRFEPSVGTVARFTTAELDVGGVTLKPGVMLRVSTMSAMRDPELYADPDRFDITRTDHPRLHSVFGLGPHRCLGEMLARIEMEEGLAALIAAAPDIRVRTEPRMIGFGGTPRTPRKKIRIN